MGRGLEEGGPGSPSIVEWRAGGTPGLSYPLPLGGGSRDTRFAGPPTVSRRACMLRVDVGCGIGQPLGWQRVEKRMTF